MSLIIENGTALAMRQGILRPRPRHPRGIVFHTTGAGPWVRWQKDPHKFMGPYDAARYIYERISKYSGHYLVCGETGSITKLVDPTWVAWHVGSKGAWRYKLPAWDAGKGLGWWHTRFPGAESPRDLLDGALWRHGSANKLTIGIEVAPPSSGPRDAWSPQAWRSLRLLSKHLCDRWGIPFDRYHLFTHSDAHPLNRTTKKGSPWDPAPGQWTIGAALQHLEISRSKYPQSLENRK